MYYKDNCGILPYRDEPMTHTFIKSITQALVDKKDSTLNVDMLHDWMDESYITDVMYSINDKNSRYTSSKLSLYKSLSLNESGYVLLESFSDYYNQADQIIKEFLKFMENKANDFCSMIEKYIQADKDLMSHRSELMKGDIDPFTGYQAMLYSYTIDDNIPNVSAIEDFSASLFDNLFKASITDLSIDAINNAINSADLEADYRVFRGKVLNREPMSEIEFGKQLRRVFRDGEDGLVEIAIPKEAIKDIAELYFNFGSNFKVPLMRQITAMAHHTENVLNKIEAICKSNNGLTLAAFTNLLPGDIRVQTVNGKSVDTEGMRLSGDMMLQLDLFCKLKLDQLQKYTDTIALAFSAKMDAIKEIVEQNRMVLIKVCEYMDKPQVYNILETDPEVDLKKDVESDVKDISMGLD